MLQFWQCKGLNWRINPCRHQKLALISEAHGVSRRKIFASTGTQIARGRTWRDKFGFGWAELSATLSGLPRVLQQRLRLNPPQTGLYLSSCTLTSFSISFPPVPLSSGYITTFHNYSNGNCSFLHHSRGVTPPSLPPPPSNTRLWGRNVSCVHGVAGHLTINLLL